MKGIIMDNHTNESKDFFFEDELNDVNKRADRKLAFKILGVVGIVTFTLGYNVGHAACTHQIVSLLRKVS
jgi:hypothetical protein